MSNWQLLNIDVHYQHADGSVGLHSSAVEEQQTKSVSTAMAQLIFSPAVWAVEFTADTANVRLTSIDNEGVSGAFLVRATVSDVERHLVYSRRRGAPFTAKLPIGAIYFTNDQMFTASPQVFFTVCSTLDRGFAAELPDGWRWVSPATAPAAAREPRQHADLRTG